MTLEELLNQYKALPNATAVDPSLQDKQKMDMYENYLSQLKPTQEEPQVPTTAPTGMADSLAARSGGINNVPSATPTATAPQRAPVTKPVDTTDNEEDASTTEPLQHDTKQNLLDAQSATRSNTLNANLLNAGQTINEAINRTKFNRDVNKNLEKQANMPVEQYKERQAGEKSDLDLLQQMYKQSTNAQLADPNSDISNSVRELFGKLGVPLPEGISALAVENTPQFDKLLGAKLKADSTKEAAVLRQQQHQDTMDQRKELAEKTNLSRDVRNLIGGAKRDKIFQDNLNRSNQVSRALGNLEIGGKIMPQDLMDLEALTISNSGANAGNSTGHEREKRFATSLGLTLSEYLQFLSGKPIDIGKENQILQRFQELAKREVNNFRDSAKKRITTLGSGHAAGLKKYPDIANDVEELQNNMIAELPKEYETEVTKKRDKGETSSVTAAGKHQPGDVVSVKGKQYKVGADGDALEPM